MPKTALTLCRRFAEDHGIFGAVSLQAAAGTDLISQVERLQGKAGRRRSGSLCLAETWSPKPSRTTALLLKVRAGVAALASIFRYDTLIRVSADLRTIGADLSRAKRCKETHMRQNVQS